MEEMIATQDICTYYNIEYSFINSLNDCGLVHITIIEEKGFIASAELPQLEKLARLHKDLEVNIEGLEVISNLLHTIEDMQQEITYLKNTVKAFNSYA
jgi:chaperone modulatory protein CbpM